MRQAGPWQPRQGPWVFPGPCDSCCLRGWGKAAGAGHRKGFVCPTRVWCCHPSVLPLLSALVPLSSAAGWERRPGSCWQSGSVQGVHSASMSGARRVGDCSLARQRQAPGCGEGARREQTGRQVQLQASQDPGGRATRGPRPCGADGRGRGPERGSWATLGGSGALKAAGSAGEASCGVQRASSRPRG